MAGELSHQDAEYLLNRPEFRRFLFAAIQGAGIIGHLSGANGRSDRDLSFFEGRRSLGFEMLQMVDQGQPEPLRSPHSLATLNALILTAINPKEKPDGKRNNRYDDITDAE